MDCRSGEIYNAQEMDHLSKALTQTSRAEDLKRFVPLTEALASELKPLGKKQRKNSMRNKPCVCGSNKKFKRCCWSKFA